MSAPRNPKPQSGRTRDDEAEAHDGMRVLLLSGTRLGKAGQVVTLSWQSAQIEIAAGRAASQGIARDLRAEGV